MNLEKERTKSGRCKYFQMLINVGLINLGIKTNLCSSNSSLIDIFKTTNFICQPVLERIMYELKIQDRGKFIELENFSAQLEHDKNSAIPYWNIVFETKYLTTAACISRAMSKKIFDTNIAHPTIKIHSIINFKDMDKNCLFCLPNSDWYPGYFSHSTVALTFLLEKKEVQQSIQDAPDKYSTLIKLK